MEFLKAVLGDDLYKQVEEKINAHNSDEANKDKLLKLANLSEGGYVSKDKFAGLETEHNTTKGKLTEAENLIAELKKANKGDETLQNKVAEYEKKNADLEAELQQTKIDNAIQLAIRDAKGLDADYLAFKLKEKGEITLGDDGKIKGIDDMISGLKTQFPNQFEGASTQRTEPQTLPPHNNQNGGMTRADLLKKPYAERQKFFNENPDAYREIMKS